MASDPPWFGRAIVCATIMFLLRNKSRVKAFRPPPKLLHSGNKVNAVNAMRDRSADSFRQHLLDKYSMPPRAHAHVDKSGNPALTRPLRELWEATDLSAAEFADEVCDYFALPRLS